MGCAEPATTHKPLEQPTCTNSHVFPALFPLMTVAKGGDEFSTALVFSPDEPGGGASGDASGAHTAKMVNR